MFLVMCLDCNKKYERVVGRVRWEGSIAVLPRDGAAWALRNQLFLGAENTA